MTTITNLNQISKDQLKDIIESNRIVIKRTTGSYYVILCPECTKPEAHIYYNKDNRNIVCNRKNKCAYSKSLWDYIAELKGYSSKQMTEYINDFFGYEFKNYGAKNDNNSYEYSSGHIKEKKEQAIPVIVEKSDKPTKTLEEIKEEQVFFACCHEIFTEYLLNEDDKQVKHSLNYLRNDRGYTDTQIKFFKIGFFPDRDNLVKLIINKGYTETTAKELVGKHFSGIVNHNQYLKTEEARNRITLSWCDIDNNVIGFSVRKHTSNSEFKSKYFNNSGLSKSNYLFNFTSDAIGKEIVIVEGQFDALVGTYYFAQEETSAEKYHFIAIGGSSISDNQIDQLLNANCRKVTLLLDTDDAGIKGAQEGARKLIEKGITAYIARIPKQYECNDVDELIYKYQDEQVLSAILKDAQIQEHDQNTNLTNTMIMTEINNLPPKDQTQEELANKIKELLQEIKKDQIDINENTGEKKRVPIDYLKYAKRIFTLREECLGNSIGHQKKQDANYIALNSILPDIMEYNNLLSSDETNDKPYKYEQFLQDIQNVPVGLKTGYKDLDQHISIQPASLAFIAGRPSHGKTTMMLNILRNMIIANPNKAFLFYSYEETRSDILIKIILGIVEDHEKLIRQLEKNGIEGGNIRTMVLSDLRQNSLCITQDEQEKHHILSPELDKACKIVEEWLQEGRLEILTPKSSTERLSTAIIERCMEFQNEEQLSETKEQKEVKKEVAAVFIDYVQKLSTEEQRVNRQQEIQRICQTLLSTVLDKRVKTSIILGAQVNREVVSFETLTLDNMREAGDIEQDANLVLGVWNTHQGEIDWMLAKAGEIKDKIRLIELGLYKTKNSEKITDIENSLKAILRKLEEQLKKQTDSSNKGIKIQIKVLKNRNGKNSFDTDLIGNLDRYLIEGKDDPATAALKNLNKQS